jgi:hypothetical protein
VIRDRIVQSIREHTWKISMNTQVWICTEGDGYNIWGKGLHGENVFSGGDVYNL